jgi:hypothetical protein
MLRPGRAPYAWPIAIALAVLAIAIVLFAANQEDNEVADTGTPAATTGTTPTGSPSPESGKSGSAQ